MKTAKMIHSGKRAVLAALFGATVSLSTAAEDITAFVRAAGADAYAVEAGTDTQALNGCPIGNAFDGKFPSGDESARVMLQTTAGKPTPVRILYSISDSAFPGYEFTVTSFTLYRMAGVYNSMERTATEFKLEGWDGNAWQTLFETEAATAWDWNSTSHTFTVPPANRGRYRKYLFTITANGGDASWSGFLELVLNGDITPGLVWNGADGASWDAASTNWLDGTGAATAWIPGANALFGSAGAKSVTVDGEVQVGSLAFPESGEPYSLSGGTLVFNSSATVVGGNGDVIGSSIASAAMSSDHIGWLPADATNTKQGTSVRLWKNRRLAGVAGFTAAKLYYGNSEFAATSCFFENDGSIATCQFQAMPGPLLCVKVQFEQVGSDIWAKAIYGKYSWDNDRALGKDFDSYGSEMGIYDGVISTSGYGLKDIVASGGDDLISALDFELGIADLESDSGDDWLPADDAQHMSGARVKMWENKNVADITGLAPATMWFNSYGEMLTASPYFYTNSGTVATCQYQAMSQLRVVGLCLKVQFEQDGPDIYARIVYSKSKWASDALGQNYDSYGDNNFVYDGVRNSGGLGIKNIAASFNGKMCLAGSVCAAVEVNGGTLTLGAPAIDLDREITGDGKVRFAPVSGAQTVSVTDARTLDRVVLGGATTFAFDSGASLFVRSAEIESAALVDVLGANLLRIGMAKCMSKEQRAHFTVNGAPSTQDNEGWIVPESGTKIVIR